MGKGFASLPRTPMGQVLPDVFTPDELARAAGATRSAVEALIASGELRVIPGTRFIAAADALRIGRRLRAAAPVAPPVLPAFPPELFAPRADGTSFVQRRGGIPAFASSLVHVVLLVIVLSVTSGRTETAAPAESREETRLVFLMTPGPGGGGGGGGLRNPLPARKVERRGAARERVTVPAVTPERVLTSARAIPEPPKPAPAAVQPKPVERAPEPLPARVLVAPVVAAASSPRDAEGVIEDARGQADSQGSGVGGGAGTGQGTGNGEGLGSGIGDGSGGGTGGGPFRPGSGIEPPRLLREVKAEYTDEARRRGISGDVVLEIVVRRDGSVGEVTLLQGLGSGLDQRAVNAVRQWRFSPARRRGEPVDVIVEVAVEFTLR